MFKATTSARFAHQSYNKPSKNALDFFQFSKKKMEAWTFLKLREFSEMQES